jgi:hypothetical protein
VIRFFQIALLLAIIVPFSWAVKSGVMSLSKYHLDLATAALVGFILCYALWRWDERIRQRGTGN